MADAPEVGSEVLVQEVWNDKVWSARPMRVVLRSDEQLGLWMPEGTAWRAPNAPAEAGDLSRAEAIAWCLENDTWDYLERVWKMSTLWLVPRGSYHAVWWCWDKDELLGWYVNFQTPMAFSEPSRLTFMDLMVDARVGLDGSWSWKDEDDLELMVRRGIFDPLVARRPLDEALRLQTEAATAQGAFNPKWRELRPAVPIPLPHLPTAWRDPGKPTA